MVCASTLASNGVDLYTLQALLTHGSLTMTQRYAHLSNDHLRDAANVANRLAGKKGGQWGKRLRKFLNLLFKDN